MTNWQLKYTTYDCRRRKSWLAIFARVVFGTLLALAVGAFFLAPWLTFDEKSEGDKFHQKPRR